MKPYVTPGGILLIGIFAVIFVKGSNAILDRIGLEHFSTRSSRNG